MGINTIYYNIEEVDDENIDVIYKEEFIGKTNSMDLNFKIMNFSTRKDQRKEQ